MPHKGGRTNGRLESYLNQDLREIPTYGVSEAAHYLQLPQATLRSWVVGRPYSTAQGRRFFQPLINLADKKHHVLSFMNLIEAHVLSAIRRKHKISLPKVRTALNYLKKDFPSKHPLADQKLETDGLNLFLRQYGRLINLSEDGQLAIREIIEAHLRRIEWDLSGLPARLYLFTGTSYFDQPKAVVVDPHISSGRPVIAGTGIPTAVIAERYKAGEPIVEIAEDYGRKQSEIEEAIRCELWLEAA